MPGTCGAGSSSGGAPWRSRGGSAAKEPTQPAGGGASELLWYHHGDRRGQSIPAYAMMMASVGQLSAASLQQPPVQAALSFTTALPSPPSMANISGQISTHTPQPMHRSVSMLILPTGSHLRLPIILSRTAASQRSWNLLRVKLGQAPGSGRKREGESALRRPQCPSCIALSEPVPVVPGERRPAVPGDLHPDEFQ